MIHYKVRCDYGQYHSVVDVFSPDALENEEVIEKAWATLRRRGILTLPMCYTASKITEKTELDPTL